MKPINSREALSRLLKSGSKFLIDADSLNYLIQNKKTVVCYEDADCVIFIYKDKDKEYVTAVPLSCTFQIASFLELVYENCVNPSLLINVQELSPECLDMLDCLLSKNFDYERTLEDYICSTSTSIIPTHPNIRLLNNFDKELFVAISAEPERDRPPLHVLFDVFVNRKQGYILGFFENEKIVGYLSFNQMLPDIFDVDYIYVEPSMRGKGLGKELGQYYAAYAVENKHIAYWSNAKNTLSKKTARSCGFKLIRKAKKYTKKQ